MSVTESIITIIEGVTSIEHTVRGNLHELPVTHRTILQVWDYSSHSRTFVITYLSFLNNKALRETTCPVWAPASTPFPGVYNVCLSQ